MIISREHRLIRLRRMLERHVEYMGKKGSVYTICVRNPEGKSQIGRPRLRGNYFKIDLQARGCENLE